MNTRAEKIKILKGVSIGKVNLKELRDMYDLSGSSTVFNLIKHLIAEDNEMLFVYGITRADILKKIIQSKSIEELQMSFSDNERFYFSAAAKRKPINYGRLITNSGFFDGIENLQDEELRILMEAKEDINSQYYCKKFTPSFLNCETIEETILDGIEKRILLIWTDINEIQLLMQTYLGKTYTPPENE